MNRERLSQMVVMLRNLPEEKREKLDLQTWRCGTTACAIGWACLDPTFNEQGLRLNYDGLCPRFEDWKSWNAVDRFFDLERLDTEYLFSFDAYSADKTNDPAVVAARIESFLDDAEA